MKSKKTIKHLIGYYLPDRIYLEYKYRQILGKNLNLKKPETFNEKLQWIKLYDRNPLYTKLVDKYEAKVIVSSKIGAEYVIPTYAVWDSVHDINLAQLPNQFVLKCTHDSGSCIVCQNKDNLKLEEVKQRLDLCLKRNYFYYSREWPYKNVRPRIIAEELLDINKEKKVSGLVDYKIQCFYGQIDHIFVCVGRGTKQGVRYYYVDKDWNFLPYSFYNGATQENFTVPRPLNFYKMLEIAKELSEGIPEVRVDLYNINGKIYFGEFTFFSQGGFDTTITDTADTIIGKKFDLSHIKN